MTQSLYKWWAGFTTADLQASFDDLNRQPDLLAEDPELAEIRDLLALELDFRGES